MIGKKFLCFAVCCAWLFGTIGGIGFALYGGSWPCAIGCAVNSLIAFFTVKRLWKYLKD